MFETFNFPAPFIINTYIDQVIKFENQLSKKVALIYLCAAIIIFRVWTDEVRINKDNHLTFGKYYLVRCLTAA